MKNLTSLKVCNVDVHPLRNARSVMQNIKGKHHVKHISDREERLGACHTGRKGPAQFNRPRAGNSEARL